MKVAEALLGIASLANNQKVEATDTFFQVEDLNVLPQRRK